MTKAQIYTELDDPQDIDDLELQNLTVSGNVGIGITTPTSTPPSNSQFSFELTSNTNLRIKVRGTDGVLRSADITLY